MILETNPIKTLASVFVVAALSVSCVSAQTVLFDPDFSTGTNPTTVGSVTTPGTAPLTYSAGGTYTEQTSGSGTIDYTDGDLVVGGLAADSSTAYVTSFDNTPDSQFLTTKLTFTPNYSAIDPEGNARSYSQTNLLTIISSNSNNPLLQIAFQAAGYGTDEGIISIDSGIQFGQDGQQKVNGGTTYGTKPIDSMSGQTFSLTLYQKFISNASGPSEVITKGFISDAANSDLANFSLTVTSNDNISTGFNPAINPLTFDVGLLAGSSGGGVLNPGATATIISASVVTGVPEPSAYALLLGGAGLLAFVVRRRLIA